MSDLIRALISQSGKGRSLDELLNEQEAREIGLNADRLMEIQNRNAREFSQRPEPTNYIGGQLLESLPPGSIVTIGTRSAYFPERLWNYEWRKVRMRYFGIEIIHDALVLTILPDALRQINSEVNHEEGKTSGIEYRVK